MLRRLLIDVTPLRVSPAFRRLWIGTTLSSIGGALTMFALPLQVYDVTRSTLDVGLLSAVELVPAITIGLFGGALADMTDRRRLVMRVTVASALESVALAATADVGHGALWIVYVLAGAQSATSAISGPARRTLVPALLGPDLLRAGLALNRITFQVMLTAGPALAGVITAVPALGLRGCYLIDAVTYGASLYGVGRIGAVPAATAPVARRSIQAVREGLAFIRTSPRLIGAFLGDLSATVFALPVALFPAINAARFGGNPHTLGLFTAAIGVGGLMSALLSGPFVRVRRQGLLMLVCVAVWGAAFALFALAAGLALTLGTLALAGAVDSITVVVRGTIVQTSTPDALRGRVSAVEYVVGLSGGQLGNLEAGALGSLTSPATSALCGGLATIAAAGLIALALPGFIRVTDDPPAADASARPA